MRRLAVMALVSSVSIMHGPMFLLLVFLPRAQQPLWQQRSLLPWWPALPWPQKPLSLLLAAAPGRWRRNQPDEPEPQIPKPRSHVGRSSVGRRRRPMRASGEPDSRRLHTIMARLAMRAVESREVIANPQL